MIKKLASCIRQYKRDSMLAPLFIVGEGFMEVVIPLFMARLIDSGIDKGSMPAILRRGLLRRRLPDLPETCAMTCTIRYRNIPLATLISFQRQVL